MNDKINKLLNKKKTFCIDCKKWNYPIEDYKGIWCPKCFPKGIKSWNDYKESIGIKNPKSYCKSLKINRNENYADIELIK